MLRRVPGPGGPGTPPDAAHRCKWHLVEWLAREWLRHAQELLERTDDSVDVIATESGFGTAEPLDEDPCLRPMVTRPLATRRRVDRRPVLHRA